MHTTSDETKDVTLEDIVDANEHTDRLLVNHVRALILAAVKYPAATGEIYTKIGAFRIEVKRQPYMAAE